MSETDPELRRLLILELERHLPELESGVAPEVGRRAVHALKGSAGLAGEAELAMELQLLERRLQGGDAAALAETHDLAQTARDRLLEGKCAVHAVWPEPPTGLAVRPIEPSLFAQYHSEVTDRLIALDAALDGSLPSSDAVTVAYRQVHTMKGASSAVGDEPMAWFCHGLEERLRDGSAGPEAAERCLEELARYRSILGALLEDPDSALASLRANKRSRSNVPMSVPAPMDMEPRSVPGEESTVRVSFASVDRLLERVNGVSVLRDSVLDDAVRGRAHATRARQLRAELAEALRLIGPPRPWGAPAAALRQIAEVASALTGIGEELEIASTNVRRRDPPLREGIAAAKRELSAMREAKIGTLFSRLTAAVEAEARRSGREIVVRTEGDGEAVDRRVLEQLAEPCLQLARNSVAHGIEPADERAEAGKPRVGTIRLTARKLRGRLRITIADDGAGVDVSAVRARAVETGAIGPELAAHADDDTLLALLFLPGFSTRGTSDLLAGRGVGLDIVLASVQRLGGGVRLSSRRGEGMVARVDVPVERGVARVVFVRAGDDEYAIPITQVGTVEKNDGALADVTPHLSTCLDREVSAHGALRLALVSEGDDELERVFVAVDAVSPAHELLLRPLTALVLAMGPFSGAVLRPDGTLRLALDGYALAPRARALGHVHAGTPSERPRPM